MVALVLVLGAQPVYAQSPASHPDRAHSTTPIPPSETAPHRRGTSPTPYLTDTVSGEALTVYLVTMGPGEKVWERFGHNAIWIRDEARGTNQAYNYGLFDFRQEDFILRFLRGHMWYWMQGFDAEPYLRTYVRDDRSVWVQELNLPPAARAELRDFLEWNERPENRYYRYDYYRDNCSTRVRDALDRVIGGAIRRQTDTLPAGTTYRFHTRRLTTNDASIYTGLLLALGEPVDRPISVYEEMFLPMAMREHLRQVTIPGPDGRPVPLVRAERTFYERTGPVPPPAPPSWLPGYLLLGVLVGGSAVFLAIRGRASTPIRFGLSGVVSLWAVVVGVAGVMLIGLWAFTDHEAAYHNENILQTSLFALPLVALAPRAAAGSRRAARAAFRLAAVLAVLSALGLLLKLLPGFDQVNGEIIALALPTHLGVAGAMWVASRGT